MRKVEGKRNRDLRGLSEGVGWVDWALASALLASALLPPRVLTEGPVLCLFRRITEHPCPGCGLTRSFVATAHLRLGEAFALHLFGPVLFLGLAVAVFWRVLPGRRSMTWSNRGLLGCWPAKVLVSVWILWAGFRLGTSIWG